LDARGKIQPEPTIDQPAPTIDAAKAAGRLK